MSIRYGVSGHANSCVPGAFVARLYGGGPSAAGSIDSGVPSCLFVQSLAINLHGLRYVIGLAFLRARTRTIGKGRAAQSSLRFRSSGGLGNTLWVARPKPQLPL